MFAQCPWYMEPFPGRLHLVSGIHRPSCSIGLVAQKGTCLSWVDHLLESSPSSMSRSSRCSPIPPTRQAIGGKSPRWSLMTTWDPIWPRFFWRHTPMRNFHGSVQQHVEHILVSFDSFTQITTRANAAKYGSLTEQKQP